MTEFPYALCGMVLIAATAVLPAAGSTAAESVEAAATRIVAGHTALFKAPPGRIPTTSTTDAPLLGNGDVGVAVGGGGALQRLYIGKNDFWYMGDWLPHVITVGVVELAVPALAGASYRQEQDLLHAEVRGTFTNAAAALRTRSFVSAHENLLVTELRVEGDRPLPMSAAVWVGASGAPASGDLKPTGKPLNIGREQCGGGRYYFDGLIDEVRIYDRALGSNVVQELYRLQEIDDGLIACYPFEERDAAGRNGKIINGGFAEGRKGSALKCNGSTCMECPAPKLAGSVTVSAWVKPNSHGEARYILSVGEWSEGFSLGISGGKPRFAIGSRYAQSDKEMPLNTWTHLAGVFDGTRIALYVNGEPQAVVTLDSAGGVEEAGKAGPVAWATRAASPEGTANRRTAALAMRVLGAKALAENGRLAFVVPPGKTVTLVTAILSDLDAKDPLDAGRKRVKELTPGLAQDVRDRHQNWWRQFWSRSFIEIPDKVIEQFWYGGLYIMASCSRSGKIPPGLWGNWITTDSPEWSGDFHMNYNHEAPFWGLYSANHVDTADSYETPILDAMPMARNQAKGQNRRGLSYPVGIAPWGKPAFWQTWGQKSDAAYGAINMAMRFYATWDLDYARKVYPYMKETAEFWEDDLKFEPFDKAQGGNGRYMIYKDAIQEDLNGSSSDVNPILTLGLLRTDLKALIDMSVALGVDADRREKWEHMRTHLPEFPIQQRSGKTVFRYTEKGTDWWGDNALGIQHIWPAGAIGLDSDPKLLEICRDTITVMARWEDNNGFPTFYTAAARVGYDPGIILQHLREQCGKHGFPNLHIYFYGGGVENCGGIVSAPNEMLMQSHEGVIRLFPVWPRGMDARFGNLRAYGAFLVSSERKDSQISHVRIVSEKGRDCVVENPWADRKVQVIRSGRAAEVLSGKRLTFQTGAGEEIALTCCASPSNADGKR